MDGPSRPRKKLKAVSDHSLNQQPDNKFGVTELDK